VQIKQRPLTCRDVTLSSPRAQRSAATQDLRGYTPNPQGALHYKGGGFRTAYIEA
jgi:hypothetical protein